VKSSFAFLIIFVFTISVCFADTKDSCITCHSAIGSVEAEAFKNDVHFKNGLSCAECHGGDSSNESMEGAMDKAKGYIGVPKPADIPAMCGTCHSDLQQNFETGIHGTALKNNSKGPQCVSCHGIHDIIPVKDKRSPVFATHVTKVCSKCHSDAAYMQQFNPGLPVDQYEKYLTSVHGKRNAEGDTKAATCVSCHSNHLIFAVKDPRSPVSPMKIPSTCAVCHNNTSYMAQYHIPTTQYDEYVKSVHGVALLKNSDLSAPACNSCHGNHGATPPGVESVASVCGQCHQANAEPYDKSIHHVVFQEQSLPGCVVCHSNHLVIPSSDAMIDFNNESVCGTCHSDEPGDKAAPVIRSMRDTLNALSKGHSEATKVLDHAEQLGMDVVEAKYQLKDANQSLVESRVKIHTFAKEPVLESAAPGMKIIAQAKEAGKSAIKEYYFRRKGLAVSTLLLTLLVVLLYLKIRQIERE
jgi:predicted CXXCH cytochrome family protein